MSVRRLFSSNFAFSINFIIRREVNYLTFIYFSLCMKTPVRGDFCLTFHLQILESFWTISITISAVLTCGWRVLWRWRWAPAASSILRNFQISHQLLPLLSLLLTASGLVWLTSLLISCSNNNSTDKNSSHSLSCPSQLSIKWIFMTLTQTFSTVDCNS